MPKPLASITLFFCLLAPVVATFSYLQYQKKCIRKAIKHQMVEGLDRDDLVLLRFTAEESQYKLRWEHEKEFEFQNQMYDVVEKEQRGDTIYYWCWWDYEETQLNRQLNTLVAKVLGNNPQKNDSKKQVLDFYKKLISNKSQTPIFIENIEQKMGFAYLIKVPLQGFQNRVSPPPQLN